MLLSKLSQELFPGLPFDELRWKRPPAFGSARKFDAECHEKIQKAPAVGLDFGQGSLPNVVARNTARLEFEYGGSDRDGIGLGQYAILRVEVDVSSAEVVGAHDREARQHVFDA